MSIWLRSFVCKHLFLRLLIFLAFKDIWIDFPSCLLQGQSNREVHFFMGLHLSLAFCLFV